MGTGLWSLGNTLDVAIGINLVADLAAGANTGKRIHMRNYDNLLVVLLKNAASAGTDDVVIQVQEHNAASSGTSQNLAAANITTWYVKTATTLAGTEAWTEVTQTADSKVTVAGATYGAKQAIVAFNVQTTSLADGFEWLSVNIADPGSGGTILGGVIYIPTGLKMQRRPDLLAQPNA